MRQVTKPPSLTATMPLLLQTTTLQQYKAQQCPNVQSVFGAGCAAVLVHGSADQQPLGKQAG